MASYILLWCVNSETMKRMYQIWQWGRCLYCGTKQDCEIIKQRWENKCGNIELEILPV